MKQYFGFEFSEPVLIFRRGRYVLPDCSYIAYIYDGKYWCIHEIVN